MTVDNEIPIKLYYGPLDGLELKVLDTIWDRGWVIVPVAMTPVFADAESCTAKPSARHFYVRKEIDTDNRGPILDPVYQWVYDSTA